jgi:hypothetical protein
MNLWKQVRKLWRINPKTRIKKSKKKYNRAKEKQKIKEYIKNE